MITIIDYGMGNLKSIYKALRAVNADCKVTSDAGEINSADALVLPGVGAFRDAMKCLAEKGLDKVIVDEVKNGKPFLGICLGMQMMFEKSFENGEYNGLGILKGYVCRITGNVKVPHMGWNSLNIRHGENPLFEGLNSPAAYFVHSYHCLPEENIISASSIYGSEITAAVQKENIYGLQFHPEKSGIDGLHILENFRRLVK